ncbi:transporter substrate-binding domain-containing protein [Vibrio sp. S9_S30]|uniref:substrate-binding periplasmic protein n=1 Tax=Vibrio sp. S9_S30 TaxID=2720226 RepID=UPI0016806459|nr:transporter substrate-binding domain-containing protein [Vibrio sp. S9_S30]MBD1555622.1 transporter substrate-binding domain-containing protein [Vibrio sp. S9_S30]
MLNGKIRVLFLVMFFSLPVISKELSLAAIHYPPYTIINDDNEVTGTDAKIVVDVMAMQGIRINLISPPWSRALKSVKHGKISGLVSCTKNKSRSQYMLFSDPIDTINNGLIVRNSYIGAPLKHISDLNGIKLIAIHKWNTQTELVRNNIPHAQANSIPQALDMLLRRNFDAIYSGTESVKYFAEKSHKQDKLKVILFEERPPITLHMCLGKQTPNAREIIARFNQDLATYKATKD